jgi:hypothetical protein
LFAAVIGAVVALALPQLWAHAHGHGGASDAALAHTEATFRFTADAPVAEVAPLFGAERERRWAPGWEPRFLHPTPAADQRGMVFTVSHGHADSIWVNSELDLARGVVQYVYVIPQAVATLITLHLTPEGARTRVEVTYARTALDAQANAHVEQLGAEDGQAGSEWEQQINDYLHRAAAR